jgi:hypothetical protein
MSEQISESFKVAVEFNGERWINNLYAYSYYDAAVAQSFYDELGEVKLWDGSTKTKRYTTSCGAKLAILKN